MARENVLIGLAHDRRIQMLGALVLLALLLAYFNGIKFGIDFSGGTRLPVLIEDPPKDPAVLEETVDAIRRRLSSFGGLGEVKVRAIGNTEVHVELPSSDPGKIADAKRILSQQGVFIGVVDGGIAVSSEDIFSGTIERVASQFLQGSDWGVSFTVTQKGARKFAEAANGKADYPLYMFLDRPDDAIIVINRRSLISAGSLRERVSEEAALEAVKDALRLGNGSMPVYISDDFENYKDTLVPKSNRTKAIISANESREIKEHLAGRGFVIVEKSDKEMTPLYTSGKTGKQVIREWSAAGLRSSAFLSPGITNGVPNYAYQISGPAEGNTATEKARGADAKVRELQAILKGGALPVRISLGSETTVPAPLGAEFLRISIIGAAFALLTISLMVALRYRTAKVVLPIIFISLSEMIILVAILGTFTIDLGGMAGIIAAIGVSVDAQIVVTDELLKKEGDAKKRMERAFEIIITNAIVAFIAMVPLLFSGLIEVMGFATATILGATLGALVSRPAYGAIVEKLFEG